MRTKIDVLTHISVLVGVGALFLGIYLASTGGEATGFRTAIAGLFALTSTAVFRVMMRSGGAAR